MDIHRHRRRFDAFANPLRLLALLLLPLGLAAADEATAPLFKKNKAEDPDVLVTEGIWENSSGSVERKFDTPGGAVYRFPKSTSYSMMYQTLDAIRAGTDSFHSSRSCKCDTCILRRQFYPLEASIPPAKKKKMRFAAVEFFIRKFPAMQSDTRSSLEFTLAFSSYPEIKHDPARITGILERPYNGIFCYFDEVCRGPGDSEQWVNSVLNPQFGWNHYRIVFDTGIKRITIFSNGNLMFTRPLLEIKGQAWNINSVAIYTDQPHMNLLQTLELSHPVFYRFDRLEDLLTLPPAAYQHYPYGLYGDTKLKMYHRWQTNKNPDARYAEALRHLRRQTDEPLTKAIDLLEKASKDDHVFANYELGVCYMYGVGVRQDAAKARKYFHKAVKNGYEDDTQSARFLLLMTQVPHEIFLSPELLEANQDCLLANQTSSEVTYYLNRGFSGFNLNRKWAFHTFNPTLQFTDDLDTSIFPWPWDNIYFGKKILSGSLLTVNRIPVSAMFAGIGDAESTDDPARWYIGRLKRYMFDNYPGAFSRYGEIWRDQAWNDPVKKREFLRHALTAFLRGAQLGDEYSAIEVWRTQSALGTLRPEDFSAATDIRFHRNPQYYLLKYLAAHPGQDWESAFQRKNYPWALRKMPPPDTPERKYLRGLMLVAPYFDGNEGFRKVRYRLMDGFPEASGLYCEPTASAWNQAIEGYQLIEEAAEAGLPEAQFLIGMLYMVTPEKTVTTVRWSNNRAKGVKLLSSLDPAKWPPASYYIAQYTSQQTNLNIKIAEWEKRLKPACDANFGPAWYLLGQLYERYNYPPKAEAAYIKAGDAGMNLGYSAAACMMDESRRDSRAVWQRFLKLHLEERRRSRLDPLDDSVTVHCAKWRMPPNLYYPTFDFLRLLP